jgi:hypothetical protein
MFKYLSDGQGSAPPVATDLTLLTVVMVKPVLLVNVRVIPSIAAQLGSRTAIDAPISDETRENRRHK